MAERNRSVQLSELDIQRLQSKVTDLETYRQRLGGVASVQGDSCAALPDAALDCIVRGDGLELSSLLPDASVPLIFADPPYAGLRKRYESRQYDFTDVSAYRQWLIPWLDEFKRLLTPDGTLYFCGDWRGASVIQPLLEERFNLQNRITWEREKGRGAKQNWKNSHEDIWFCTKGSSYTFNVDAVKILRQVKAPYRQDGKPKDWQESETGARRLTYPGNIWSDLTVPFWSMRENTEHPTQKPEKLLARLLLASSNAGDLIFDPFLGSGTSAATAVKLGRRFIGCELELRYCLLAAKRLELAAADTSIQGTFESENGIVFLERNSNPGIISGDSI